MGKRLSLLFSFLFLHSINTYAAEPGRTIQNHVDGVSKVRQRAKPKQGVANELFGVKVEDPFRWLEPNAEGSADLSKEVIEWMNAQNERTTDVLAKIPGREALKKRLESLRYYDSVGKPHKFGNRIFYTKKHKGKEKHIYYWREEGSEEEHVFLDPNKLSDDGSISIKEWSPSEDGKKVAYVLSENNKDRGTLYIMDIDTGKTIEGEALEGQRVAYPQWTKDNKGFFYRRSPQDPTIKSTDLPMNTDIRYHKIGTHFKDDKQIFDKTGDPDIWRWASLSEDGKHLFLNDGKGWSGSKTLMRDLDKPDQPFRPIFDGIESGTTAHITSWNGKLYAMANDGSPGYRIDAASQDNPERKDWKTLIPERDGVVIENFSIIGGHLVLTVLKNAANEIEVYTLDGKFVRKTDLPDVGSVGAIAGRANDETMYYTFSSLNRPSTTFKANVRSGESEVFNKLDIPFNSDDYQVTQEWVNSKDGTTIPYFMVQKKNQSKDGDTPTLLYGYGGFNVNMSPYFNSRYVPWLEAGGKVAIPNLRGGGEFGEEWHKQGMLEKKQNVFDDFIAVAEGLIRKGHTNSRKLVIDGASNGGLLTGAALTQRPELFKGVSIRVPLLDMIRYHKFGSGKDWMSEYGNPDNENDFKYLLRYSPYHNVKEGVKYPGVYIQTADSDDRVDPMHARKMAALLQRATAGKDPILLRVTEKGSHGGGDMVKKGIEDDTDLLLFLMNQVGIQPKTKAIARQ